MPNDQEKPTTPTPDDVRFNQLQTYYKDASNKVTWLLGVSLTIFIVIAGIIVPLVVDWHRGRSNKAQMEALKTELNSYTQTLVNDAITQLQTENEVLETKLNRELAKTGRSLYSSIATVFKIDSKHILAATMKLQSVRNSIKLGDVVAAKSGLDTVYDCLIQTLANKEKWILPPTEFMKPLSRAKEELTDAKFPKECLDIINKIEKLLSLAVQIKPVVITPSTSEPPDDLTQPTQQTPDDPAEK